MIHETIAGQKVERPASLFAGRYLGTLVCSALALLILFLSALAWVGVKTGSILLPRQLAAEQNADPKLIALPAEIRHWAAFKLPRIAREQPEVVLIGSSRGNEVRSLMFRPYKLYNASLTCWSLEQMLAMADHVTRVSRPRVLVLSLDYFMFSDAYAAAVKGERTMYFNNDWKVGYQSSINLLRSVQKYPPLWTTKFPPYLFNEVAPRPDGLTFRGLDAIRAEAGFRWDGSFLYEAGTLINAPQRTSANKGLIDAMPGGVGISATQWAVLERIAALGRERQVKIVAIQWPILKASVDFLQNDPSYHISAGLWREFRDPATVVKLRNLGIDFYDASEVPGNGDDRNFIDAAHANESGMLNAMIDLNQRPDFRATFPSIDAAALTSVRTETSETGQYTSIYKEQF